MIRCESDAAWGGDAERDGGDGVGGASFRRW